MRWHGCKTYRFILAVLQHGLGEVAIRTRVSDVAVVALVLGRRTADTERAADNALRPRVEVALSLSACDDVLLNICEAVGRVLVLCLWNAALVARDAARGQPCTSTVKDHLDVH